MDAATWRLIRLRTAKPAGSDNLVDIELLRPMAWLRENGAEPRGVIHFSLPELGLDGPADVLAVEECPAIERGRGRVIPQLHRAGKHASLAVKTNPPPGEHKNSGEFWEGGRLTGQIPLLKMTIVGSLP